MASSAKKVESPQSAVEVKVRSGNMATTASSIWNTSLGGVFVETHEPILFGAEVELEFSLPSDPRTIRCAGFVIWSTKNSPGKARGKQGIALRLTSIGIAEMRHLAKCVARALPE